MKKLVILPAVLLWIVAQAQHDLIPQPIPGLAITNSLLTNGSNVIAHSGDILAPPSTNGNVVVPPSSTTEFISGHRVVLTNNFSAQPQTNRYFHARIADFPTVVALFSPANAISNNTMQVEQYEKLEYGVRLPQNVLDAINSFKNEIPNSQQLNPFDPTQFELIAHYKHYVNNASTWDAEYEGFGFYYEEYLRDISDQDPNNWHGVLDTTSFNARFRFAPPKTGLWRVEISLGALSVNYGANYTFWFNCVSPTDPENKGFVYRNPGEHYFRLGTDTWMPFGSNLQWPNFPGDDQRTSLVPSDRYLAFQTKMTELHNSGADFFRMHLSPISTDIEFEKLNNYFSRLYCAWEVDRILDRARELHMYMDINLMLHYQLMDPGPYYISYFDWSASHPCTRFLAAQDRDFCYRSELGLTEPLEFLTDPDAIKFYKYKLRYMMARWGYSRQIVIFEMVSEIGSVGQSEGYHDEIDANNVLNCIDENHYNADPYHLGTSQYSAAQVQNIVAQWHAEILSCLKQTLHVRQLLAVDYAGTPGPQDNSFLDPSLDIRLYNNYPLNTTKFSQIAFDTYDDYSVLSSGTLPVMNGETGGGDDEGLCERVEWLRGQWIFPFSGQASGALNWGYQPTMYPIFAVVKAFVAGEDLNDGWRPHFAQKDNGNFDKTADLLYLLKSDREKAMGIILNRSYNAYTFHENNCNCVCASPSVENTPLDPNYAPHNVNWNDDNSTLEVEGLMGVSRYKVQWYHYLTGELLSEDHQFTDIHGNFELRFPGLMLVNFELPMVAFKISFDPFIGRVAGPSLDSTMNSSGITVYPNPTHSIVSITVDTTLLVPANLSIYAANGELISSLLLTNTGVSVNLSAYAGQELIFVVTNSKKRYVHKVTVLKD